MPWQLLHQICGLGSTQKLNAYMRTVFALGQTAAGITFHPVTTTNKCISSLQSLMKTHTGNIAGNMQ